MFTCTRRQALRTSALLTALAGIGLIGPAQAAELAGPFGARAIDDVLKQLGATPVADAAVTLQSPDIAENGAVVQVGIRSTLPRTEEIHVLVAKNVNPLVASYTLSEGTEGFVQMRLKMGESSQIVAVVKADGRWYSASRETKVTLGGCGG